MQTEMRRKDREVTDIQKIIEIVDQAKILHMGLMDEGFPYVVPLHYGYEYNQAEDSFVFYMHSAKAGHKIDLINANPNICVELETDIEPDSGGDNPCRYGSFFSSVMGRGQVSILTDINEKKHALSLLMKNQTGREFEFTDKMADSVAVIKAEIRSCSAKAKRKSS